MTAASTLLSIVELGGYPNFAPLYQSKGFTVERADSMRKAVKLLKTLQPAVIIAEFNFQTDFRDRTSNLETLMATVSKMPDTRVIVFYEQEQRPQLEHLLSLFKIYDTLSFPIDEQTLSSTIDRALLD
jgi:DNA-binding NtrC family response regulator